MTPRGTGNCRAINACTVNKARPLSADSPMISIYDDEILSRRSASSMTAVNRCSGMRRYST